MHRVTNSVEDLASALLPPETKSHEASEVDVARRTLVLRNIENVIKGTRWLTAADLQQKRHVKASNPPQLISRWMEQRRIFALEAGGLRFIPEYALDELGDPIEPLKRVLIELQGMSPVMIASWFEGPNSYLNGKRPRELLATHGLDVIRSVKPSLEGPVHG